MRVEGFGFWVLGFGFRVSGFGFRVSDFGFRVSGSGFRVWGFEIYGLGYGFRVYPPPASRRSVPEGGRLMSL